MVHDYWNSRFFTFADEGKIRFSTSEDNNKEYEIKDKKENKRRIAVSDHSQPYRYLFIRNESEINLTSDSSWQESFYELTKEDGNPIHFSKLAYKLDNEEDLFMIVRERRFPGVHKKEYGSCIMVFAWGNSYVNLNSLHYSIIILKHYTVF